MKGKRRRRRSNERQQYCTAATTSRSKHSRKPYERNEWETNEKWNCKHQQNIWMMMMYHIAHTREIYFTFRCGAVSSSSSSSSQSYWIRIKLNRINRRTIAVRVRVTYTQRTKTPYDFCFFYIRLANELFWFCLSRVVCVCVCVHRIMRARRSPIPFRFTDECLSYTIYGMFFILCVNIDSVDGRRVPRYRFAGFNCVWRDDSSPVCVYRLCISRVVVVVAATAADSTTDCVLSLFVFVVQQSKTIWKRMEREVEWNERSQTQTSHISLLCRIGSAIRLR